MLTSWLTAAPQELVKRSRACAVNADMHTQEGQDIVRTLLLACADLIDREVVDDVAPPPHYWTLTGRWGDAGACLRGRAAVLRYFNDSPKRRSIWVRLFRFERVKSFWCNGGLGTQ